jgi:hypothetical protein
MIILGLGAKARQGKTYVSAYMKEAIPEIQCYAFADELKRYCKEHHDELVPQWQLANQHKHLPSPKEDPIYGYTAILQWYGTEIARKTSPNQWIDIVASRIELEQPDIAVITDVRFPNEAAFIKNHDGFLVEIIRVNKDGTRFLDPSRDPNHTSEVALDDYLGWDFTIRCKDGDLTALRSKALGVLKTIVDKCLFAASSLPDATGDSRS